MKISSIKKAGYYVMLLALAGCHNTPPSSTVILSEAELRQPAHAVEGLKVREGLTATLFASEPMMTNPTNMDIDERGRVWITEAYNYRNQLNPGHPYKQLGDRILILEDLNGDGKADTAKVFYQDTCINAALGICVLGNKVIVSCSPNVYVFTDEDGDDKADKKELLFRGIGGVQHDHAIHAFTFGPDGMLYFNFGNAGDSILDKNGHLIKDTEGNIIANKGKPYRQGMVFRCNIDGSGLEVLAHNFRNNYEVAVDAFGSLWQSDNDDDGNRGVRINYVMEYGNYGYTDEMTGAGWQASRINREDSIPYRHWHLNDPGVVPNLLQTGSGSPTGMVVYEGDLLPQVFHNQMIHGEPGHNVVRSYPVSKAGAGYTARIENIVESGQDKWFRPSDVCIAPDGSLFIADWYDPGVGGHQVGDLDKGRVFRIAPPGISYHIRPPVISTPADAVGALKSPNLSTRYLAWRKLHAMGTDAEKALLDMYADANPRYRARALWLLTKLPGKGLAYAKQAMTDKEEDIRITGIRAARQLGVEMGPLVAELVNDPSSQVRRAALIAIRHSRWPGAAAIWAQLAKQYDGKDRWYLEALGIAADGNWDDCFAAWMQQTGGNWNTAAGRDIVWRARATAALPLLAQLIEDPAADPRQHLRYFRAFDFYPATASTPVLLGLLEKHHPTHQDIINAYVLLLVDKKTLKMTPATKILLGKSLTAVEGSETFIELVTKYERRDQNEALLKIITGSGKGELKGRAMKCLLNAGGQQLVMQALGKDTAVSLAIVSAIGANQDKISRQLLAGMIINAKYQLPLRAEATRRLGAGWDGSEQLLRIVKSGTLPADLDTTAKKVLLNVWRQDIKASALAYYEPGSKDTRLPPVSQLVTMNGDVAVGKKVFSTYCSSCHLAGNAGVNFGPALTEIGSKLDKAAIYDAILHPDAGISFGYEGVLIKVRDGSSRLGYIAGETKEEIDFRMIGGVGIKLHKSDIVSRKPYGHSLMPTGLAGAMSQPELVGLVQYLSGLTSAGHAVAK